MPQPFDPYFSLPHLKLPLRVAFHITGLDLHTFVMLLGTYAEFSSAPHLNAYTFATSDGTQSYIYHADSECCRIPPPVFDEILQTIPLNATPAQQTALLPQQGFVWSDKLYRACEFYHEGIDINCIKYDPKAEVTPRQGMGDLWRYCWNDPLFETVILMQRNAYLCALARVGHPHTTSTSKFTSGSRQKKIPMRFAYAITGLSFNEFCSIIVSPKTGKEIGRSEKDYYVTPYLYDASPQPQSLSLYRLCGNVPAPVPMTTFYNSDLYSIIPGFEMVWSDELYTGFTEYMRDTHRALEIEQLWNEALLESVKLIDECLDWCEESGFNPSDDLPRWIYGGLIRTIISLSQPTSESPEDESIQNSEELIHEQSQLTSDSAEKESRQDGDEIKDGVAWKDNAPLRLIKLEGFNGARSKPATEERDDQVYLAFLFLRHNKPGKRLRWYHLRLAGAQPDPLVKVTGDQVSVDKKYHYRKLDVSTIARITRHYDKFFGEKSLPNPPSEKPL